MLEYSYMDEARAVDLLGSGLTPVQTASVLGVSEARISQLMGQEEFSARVTTRRIENTTKFINRDNKYDELEDGFLSKLKEQLAFIGDPMKILRAIQVLNAAKRRGPMNPTEVSGGPQTIVPITIPVTLAVQFVTNGNNEVIEVGGRSLTPMNSQGVMAKLKDKLNDGSRTISQALPISAELAVQSSAKD